MLIPLLALRKSPQDLVAPARPWNYDPYREGPAFAFDNPAQITNAE